MENLRGSLLMVASMLAFALEDTAMKGLSVDLPVGELLLLLGGLGGGAFAVATWISGRRLTERALFTFPVMLRSFSELATAMLYLAALASIPLAQASAIQQATPLAVTMGAALFLREQVGWRRWLSIGVGFIGVLIALRPGTDFSPMALCAVFSVFWLAVRDVVTRKVPASVSSLQLATLGFLAVVPAGALVLLIEGRALVPPTPAQWGLICGAVLCGVVGYYMLIASVRIGEMSVITPFRYTRLIFALILGWLAFGEAPDAATLIGGAVIVGSGLYVLWRQARRMATVRR
ncbi:DMT family transporter [Paenirhodobacter sp.]|uniref:DMT family transporter n=1 Tax=Paenirhodobacter sp. TaxID=1965326 RepID=UPI003B3D9CD1